MQISKLTLGYNTDYKDLVDDKGNNVSYIEPSYKLPMYVDKDNLSIAICSDEGNGNCIFLYHKIFNDIESLESFAKNKEIEEHHFDDENFAKEFSLVEEEYNLSKYKDFEDNFFKLDM